MPKAEIGFFDALDAVINALVHGDYEDVPYLRKSGRIIHNVTVLRGSLLEAHDSRIEILRDALRYILATTPNQKTSDLLLGTMNHQGKSCVCLYFLEDGTDISIDPVYVSQQLINFKEIMVDRGYNAQGRVWLGPLSDKHDLHHIEFLSAAAAQFAGRRMAPRLQLQIDHAVASVPERTYVTFPNQPYLDLFKFETRFSPVLTPGGRDGLLDMRPQ